VKQLQKKALKKFTKKQNPPNQREIVVIWENIQNVRNVASFFRTLEAMNVKKFYLTGVSQQPPFDKNLQKASRRKERKVDWKHVEETSTVVNKLQKQDFEIIALEITDDPIPYYDYQYEDKVALIAGSEVFGIKPDTLKRCDKAVYIPMYGKGLSLNVHVASAIALAHIRNLT
jgi:tRNA (guanosine-2'-O-)-methyltransferase